MRTYCLAMNVAITGLSLIHIARGTYDPELAVTSLIGLGASTTYLAIYA